MPKTKHTKKQRKIVKGWAIVSNGGVLIGGGTKFNGYTPLCVFSTRQGAKEHISTTREKDKVVPVRIEILK